MALNSEPPIETFMRKLGIRTNPDFQTQLPSFIRNTSYDEFTGYLSRLNGIILHTKKTRRGFDKTSSYKNIWNSSEKSYGYISPYVDDQESLMRNVHEATLGISETRDAALLVYLGLQAIHPFDEGNGRTGREAFFLLTQPKQELRAEERTRDYFHRNFIRPPSGIYQAINREVAKLELSVASLDLFGQIAFQDISSEKSRLFNSDIPVHVGNQCFDIFTENRNSPTSFRNLVLLKYLRDMKEIDLSSINGPVNLEIVIESFTVDDFNQIIKLHRQLKIRFVETLIDTIRNPSKYPLGSGFLKDTFFVKK